MSGGSMDYAFHHLDDLADQVNDKEIKELMNDLAKLMHDLEWWESGDYSKGQYEESLADFKKKWFGESRDERLLKYIDESLDEMKVNLRLLIGVDELPQPNGSGF